MVDILVVEDNIEMANILSDFLKREGYKVVHSSSGEEAIKYLENNNAKLVLLDIMLPGIDGFGMCELIRETSNIPIIIMSAKVDKENKLIGLELGADDYIEKPYDIDILLAKIKAGLRRNYEMKDKAKIITNGDIKIDTDATTVYFKDKQLMMTIKEYELLLLFIQNKGKTLKKEWLFDKVWGEDSFSEIGTLTVHINKLREKIEKNSKDPKTIVTIWGIGYRYEENK